MAAGASHIYLRCGYAASSRDTGALRVRENRRRLRLQVRVLHHPDVAWPLPEPAGRVDRPGSPCAGREGRERAAPHLAGHDVLWHRPPRTRRARPPAARARHDRWPRMDPPALSLSHDDRRRHARGNGRVRQGLQVHRPAAPARVQPRAEADEAARDEAALRHAARPHPRSRSRRRPADHVHRRASRARPARMSTSSARS